MRVTSSDHPSLKLPAVDVLRGVAALGVAWFHSRVDLWVGFRAIHADPESYTAWDRLFSYFSLPVSQLGGLVMMFFVLSGFCIHLPVAAKGQSPHWGAYAVRRILRIYPPYVLTLLLCFVIGILFFRSSGGAQVTEELATYASSSVMLQNWMTGGRQISLNPSLWSVPIEVEFYLVYPFLYGLWRSQGARAALVLTLLFTGIGCLFFFVGLGDLNVFFNYALIWNSGALLAEVYAKGALPPWTRWHGIALLTSFCTSFLAGLWGAHDFFLNYSWALFSFLILLWLLGPGANVFSTHHWWVHPLVFLGTISYSLYLLHFPLFKLWGSAWLQIAGFKPVSFLIPTLATLLVIPLAWCFIVGLSARSISLGADGQLSCRMANHEPTAHFNPPASPACGGKSKGAGAAGSGTDSRSWLWQWRSAGAAGSHGLPGSHGGRHSPPGDNGSDPLCAGRSGSVSARRC